ncbi:hypothetical protein MPSI1_001523 [Malassezia psittaci]|uniref:DUF159-domain-containing protein n=1 Tax=Malassezia psittaci TaxID=1821823 RepID=A0AAF0F508_9BASI|nr:hypothetical protein MPSI1_001523 [Malassezia psittaci]
MCGRFANGLNYDEFRRSVDAMLPRGDTDSSDDADAYHATYNVAPGTRYPVVRTENGSMVFETMRWGITSDKLGSATRTNPADTHRVINARSDTLVRPKSVWHNMLQSQRCVVFCQGFYEWQKVHEPGEKEPRRVPHFVGMVQDGSGRPTVDGQQKQLMPMAGLWTEVPNEPERIFVIVTTDNNSQLSFLHDRMPLILPDSQTIAKWLGLLKGEQDVVTSIMDLLKPYDGQLDCYAVPPEVGKIGESNENMIFPKTQRKDGIAAMFESAKRKSQGADEDSVSSKDTRQRFKTESQDTLLNPSHIPTEERPSSNSPVSKVKQETGSHSNHDALHSGESSRSKLNYNTQKSPTRSNGPDPSPKRRKVKESAATAETPSLDSFWKPS